MMPICCAPSRANDERQGSQQDDGGVSQIHGALDDDGRHGFHELHVRLAAEQKGAPDLPQPEGQEVVQQITFPHGPEDMH